MKAGLLYRRRVGRRGLVSVSSTGNVRLGVRFGRLVVSVGRGGVRALWRLARGLYATARP